MKASRGWWKTGASRAVSKITLELQAESGFAVGRAVFPTLLGTHIISMQGWVVNEDQASSRSGAGLFLSYMKLRFLG